MAEQGEFTFVYDIELGHQAAEEGIERASEAADGGWKEAAFQAVERVALECQFFTTDDIWPLLEGEYTHEHRAMGGVMRAASNASLCRITNQTAKSARVACHRRPLRVWRSLICTKAAV